MLKILKWGGTVTLIFGSYINAAGHYYGPHVLIIGGIIWLAAAIRMKDAPLIATNSAMVAAGVIGLTQGFW